LILIGIFTPFSSFPVYSHESMANCKTAKSYRFSAWGILPALLQKLDTAIPGACEVFYRENLIVIHRREKQYEVADANCQI